MTARAPLAVALGAVWAAVWTLAACGPPPVEPAPAPPTSSAPATPPAAPPAAGGPAAPADTAFASEADYREQRAQAVEALEAAVRTEAAAVGACRVVATGEQACGGPKSFAVYSAEASDGAEVERLAARLVALDERANAQFEFFSTCVALVPPTPVLRDGRCVAAQPPAPR